MSIDLRRKSIPEISAFHMVTGSKLDFGEIMVPSAKKAFWGKFTLWGHRLTDAGWGKL